MMRHDAAFLTRVDIRYVNEPLWFIAILFLLSSFLFVSYSTSSLNGTQPKPAARSKVNAICDLTMHIRNLGASLP